jgi:hypothetical protein
MRTGLAGIESKRFEPFRDVKSVRLSAACDRPVRGGAMTGYARMRDRLRSGEERFVHRDAAQPVEHAFGPVTEGRRRNRTPVLFYPFAEPATRNGRAIPPDERARHRDEIARFAAAVADDEVAFHSGSYREWLDTWRGRDRAVAAHGQAIMETFAP